MLLGKPVLQWCIEACEKTKLPLVIAIPENKTSQGIVAWLNEFCENRDLKITVYEGPEEDLTARFMGAAKNMNFDPIIRICGDSPFVDPQDITNVLELYKKRGFCQRINHAQCFGMDELEYADKNNIFMASREHVCLYMDQTVDYPEDIKRLTNDWLGAGSPTMKAKKRLWNIE